MAEVSVSWDATSHRLRCFGHVIHLVATAFLFGRDAEPMAENREEWRDCGCLDKLHNIVI